MAKPNYAFDKRQKEIAKKKKKEEKRLLKAGVGENTVEDVESPPVNEDKPLTEGDS